MHGPSSHCYAVTGTSHRTIYEPILGGLWLGRRGQLTTTNCSPKSMRVPRTTK